MTCIIHNEGHINGSKTHDLVLHGHSYYTHSRGSKMDVFTPVLMKSTRHYGYV